LKFDLLKNLNTACFLVLAFTILTACDRNKVFDSNYALPEKGWDKTLAVEFKDVLISDTISLHNFYVYVRNSDDYRYSNFYLFLITKLPTGKFTRDTIEIRLADLTGKWLGNGFGKIKDNQLLVRKAMRFPHSGKYDFLIEHAMREDVLKGIKNVGIRVEIL